MLNLGFKNENYSLKHCEVITEINFRIRFLRISAKKNMQTVAQSFAQSFAQKLDFTKIILK